MLKQRVITALVLLGVFSASLLVPEPWPFMLLSLLLISAAAWEWARLNQSAGAYMVATVIAVAGACLWLAMYWEIPILAAIDVHDLVGVHTHRLGATLAGFSVPAAVWWCALLLWLLGSVWMLTRGLARWASWPRFVRLLLGALLLIAAWLALIEAKYQGLNLLLSIMVLVWTADIGAYFAGRALGRRKLAPSISPGKSWEGALAGGLATQLLALCWLWLDQQIAVDSPSLYSHLLHSLGPLGLVTAVALLSVMSVVGDLVESLVKRVAQVKDSSQLLPGHGGVLDRIDALLPVMPMAMALLSLCHG
jgi:phosphatidate cytidylyltransferase